MTLPTNLKIKKSLLKKTLLETAISGGIDDDPLAIVSDMPVSPSQHMSVQLTVDRPPIEDPKWSPAHPAELGLALQQYGEMIPADQVKKFYLDFLQFMNSQAVIDNTNKK